MEGQYVTPNEYHGIIGKCPPTWHVDDDGKSCHQVRSGPKKFRVGSFEPEIRDKLKAGLKNKGKGAEAGSDKEAPSKKKLDLPANPIADEATVPPKVGKVYDVDPTKSTNKSGVADAARVGICGSCVYPPPKNVPRLPNLTEDERDVEHRFASAFEKDADGFANEYLARLRKGEIGDAPNVFSTDDAKLLSPDYNPKGASDEDRKDAMGRYNVVVHQTANAIAKRAFMRQLDELEKLPDGDPRKSVLVTNGGVASGKGYALGNVEETKALAGKVGAVWDSAGEQNGTENPWILEEAAKRGIKPVFVFVDSDPKETWENPKRGVVERARKVGRMVDARVFADSYAIGARNFKAFFDKNKEKADFVFLTSREGAPKRVDDMPKAALEQHEDEIYVRALKAIHAKDDLPPAVKRGGTIGQRIWK